MKGFTKGCLITGLILLLVGLTIGVAASLAGGGREVYKMARNGELSWGDDHDFGILNIEDRYEEEFVIEDQVQVLEEEFDDFPWDLPYEVFSGNTDKKKIAGSSVSRLKLLIGGGRIYVEESEDENIYIEAEAVSEFSSCESNGTLYMKAKSTGKYKYDDMKLWLYLPKNVVYEEIDMELGAGIGEMADLQAVSMDISMGAGQLKAANIICTRLEAEVGAGEMVLTDCQVAEEAEFSIGAGILKASGAFLGDVDVECAVGTAELKVKGQYEDFNYEVECSMGTVKIGGGTFGGLSSERTVDNNAPKDMKLECAMGGIHVKFSENES